MCQLVKVLEGSNVEEKEIGNVALGGLGGHLWKSDV